MPRHSHIDTDYFLDLLWFSNKIKTMVNVDKQIEHWRSGAQEDWDVAEDLVARGKLRHGLFFAHLSLEKTLKALVCRVTNELAPPIHNLVRLAERAALSLEPEQLDLLAEVNSFNIEGRYPELHLPPLSAAETTAYLHKIRRLLECLNNLF
ncbi:HEPN domain-containing protein [Trichloromonas acetexigens]|uniref:HEPN domain-containing protein n=1 Tax=Trichloromonas acetexigens TaxID=38815 RepID=A0A550JF84_9BACT|nr:HEPN domain-containing protein [Desulfuromonas acetexigens]TRO81870.1 HEPN domain-containing protein [Desulfuromonas acetexigens]